MTCDPFEFETRKGETMRGILCSRTKRKQRKWPCVVCGNASTLLCDGVISDGKTCDRSLCEKCTVQEPNGKDTRDFCPRHIQRGLGFALAPRREY